MKVVHEKKTSSVVMSLAGRGSSGHLTLQATNSIVSQIELHFFLDPRGKSDLFREALRNAELITAARIVS